MEVRPALPALPADVWKLILAEIDSLQTVRALLLTSRSFRDWTYDRANIIKVLMSKHKLCTNSPLPKLSICFAWEVLGLSRFRCVERDPFLVAAIVAAWMKFQDRAKRSGRCNPPRVAVSDLRSRLPTLPALVEQMNKQRENDLTLPVVYLGKYGSRNSGSLYQFVRMRVSAGDLNPLNQMPVTTLPTSFDRRVRTISLLEYLALNGLHSILVAVLDGLFDNICTHSMGGASKDRNAALSSPPSRVFSVSLGVMFADLFPIVDLLLKELAGKSNPFACTIRGVLRKHQRRWKLYANLPRI